MKKIFLGLSILLYLLPVCVNASTPSEQRRALINTANAYFDQGNQIQYDSYRKNLNSTPEDATSKHTVYTVCSGFIYMSYYQALGVKIPDSTEDLLKYAEDNNGTANVIFYYGKASDIYKDGVLGKGRDTVTKAEKEAFIKSIIDNVNVGDIFVYQGTSGHTMLVKSVDKENNKITLMEGNGDRYDYVNHEEKYDSKGAVYDEIDFADRLYSNRDQMALIRIITDGKTFDNLETEDNHNDVVSYDITDSAKTRIKYPKINIGKIINNVEDQSFARLGDELVYQIRVRNNTKATEYTNVVITEEVDSSLKIVSVDNYGGKATGNKIKWTIAKIEPGKYVTLTYKVKIPENNSLLGKVIVSKGNVEGIATSRIETRIGKGLTTEEKDKLKTTFNSLKKTSKASSGRRFIIELYSQALGINLETTYLQNLNFLYYSSTNKSGGNEKSLSVKYTTLEDAQKKYLYSNYYGLRVGSEHYPNRHVVKISNAWNRYAKVELNDRARSITKSVLEDGDIILRAVPNDNWGKANTKVEDMYANQGYVYLNNTLYRFKSTNSFEEIKGDALTKFLNDLVGHNYIILRPYTIKPVSMKVSQNPNKLKYALNSSELDLTNGKLLVTYSDGSTKTISMKNERVTVTGFSTTTPGKKTLTVKYRGCTAKFNIEVEDKKTQRIHISSFPVKREYIQYMENLDLTGGVISVEFNDSTSTKVSFKNSKVKVTGFDNKKIGKQRIIVSYNGFNAPFDIEIIETAQTSLIITSKPIKASYSVSTEKLDLTGGVITINEEDGTQETISLENENVKVTGFDNSKNGVQNIKVEYEGATAEFPIEIINKSVSSIEISELPVKTNYLYNQETIDVTGGILKVTYEDGTVDYTSMTNENISINGYNNNIIGTNTITAQYQNVTTSFDVNVINKNVSGIEIQSLPTKTTYIKDKENIDLTNGILLIKYDDGTTDQMSLTNSNIVINGFDNTKIGNNNIEIEYSGHKANLEIEIIDSYDSIDNKDDKEKNEVETKKEDNKASKKDNKIIFIVSGIIIAIAIIVIIILLVIKKNKKPTTIPETTNNVQGE